jgi:radical SAM superfamily enzyme YgiQ (UPF0313 family)
MTAGKDITLVHISLSRPRTVPMGVLYIAAALERIGVAVDLRDYPAESYLALDPDDLVSALDDAAPVIGVSCMSDALPFVLYSLQQLRAGHPEKRIILGGPGPTGAAAELLEHFPSVDVVVIGEGEETAAEVVPHLIAGSDGELGQVKGIAFRSGDQVCVTGERARIRDLDRLPMPSYDCLPMSEYHFVNLVLSRGCPFKCTFCDVAPMWQRRNRRRSVDSVVDELVFLHREYRLRNFEFADETFVLNRKHVLRFCERLREERLDVEWACTGRIDLMNEELLEEMSASGCRGLFFGIESGSNHVLGQIRKEFTAEQAVEGIFTAQKYMRVVASFIWGFPGESREDFLKTLFLILFLEQHGVDARLNRLSPFALTPLYQQHRDQLIRRRDGAIHAAHDPFQTSALRPQIAALIDRYPTVFPEFYWLPTPDLEDKAAMVDALNRHRHLGGWPAASTAPREAMRHDS